MPPAVKYKIANTIARREELAKVLIKLIKATNGEKVTMSIKNIETARPRPPASKLGSRNPSTANVAISVMPTKQVSTANCPKNRPKSISKRVERNDKNLSVPRSLSPTV